MHRIVAHAFLGVPAPGAEVNHLNGVKTDNRAANLEWVTSKGNKSHAVIQGLSTQALPVVDPGTGKRFPSISEAARQTHRAHRTVRATFLYCGGAA